MMHQSVPAAPNLGLLLLRAFEWFDDALLARQHAMGWGEMTRPFSLIFGYLEPGGSRPSGLARRIGVSRQAIHATLNEMVALDLITLAPDPHDQRAKLVVPTERGRHMIAAARAILADLERELAARIGADTVAALRAALEADWGTAPTDPTPPAPSP
jgi:DNA-binding MarR family transcriptional regulator